MNNKQEIIKLDSYKLNVNDIVVNVDITLKRNEFVPTYSVSILNISKITNIILHKIREEFVSKVNIGDIQITDTGDPDIIKNKFGKEILVLIKKYFPDIDKRTSNLLVNYLIQENIGLGNVEILLRDKNLEDIVINNARDPVWVYHRKHGWLKTNVRIPTESKIRHYSTMIGRDVGKEITLLKPLMDASLPTGDRVNATLSPISTDGNTISIRKFAEKPWTITDFIKGKTLSYYGAALIWLAVQNELSVLITGGTGSGKTSMLNVISNFFPPNQRIISIEDTRELTLPDSLHWVPLETRLPNPEGKGEVTMLDILVNSLRMRPDRMIVGEIRRKKEAEVLFEAMHTGHSVYATLHANNAQETVVRMTNPPIEIPKLMLPALSLIVVQHLDRRTGRRRTLQIAEVLPTGDPNVLLQLDAQRDELKQINESKVLMDTINLYTGLTPDEIKADINEKINILKWLVKNNITNIHQMGLIFAKYYIKKLKH
ncbi:MAG: Flp pilus assembly complex ATPase component TadA [Nanoarchaeota archaeon]|nr:Flp pilus assembly complex ATPase component TadA [Nanoarchaeota archaeon]MBU4493640.1 Flp pilus assembly complex ATPase component TadA [Nanoarchaeota archaeon]